VDLAHAGRLDDEVAQRLHGGTKIVAKLVHLAPHLHTEPLDLRAHGPEPFRPRADLAVDVLDQRAELPELALGRRLVFIPCHVRQNAGGDCQVNGHTDDLKRPRSGAGGARSCRSRAELVREALAVSGGAGWRPWPRRR
jgi:hypothetical protein